MSLLAGGCVEHVEDNIVIGSVEVTFTTHVTGRAIVRWSDGVDTHAVEFDSSGEQTWTATVGQNQFVAAMTAVPVGKGSKARYRVATRNGGAFVDDLAGGQRDERQFTVVGPVTMVVVAQEADDVIGCRISDANGDLSVQSAMGLGAIVACHSFVNT